MALIGYARTSTKEQVYGLEQQKEDLERLGVEKIFSEQVSSVDTERKELRRALDYIRTGDTLVVMSLDRLARSVADVVKIQQELESKGAGLRIERIGLDTSKENGNQAQAKLYLNMLSAIAEFEREILLERQRAGIERAKKEGKYKGRKAISADKKKHILALLNDKDNRWTKEEIAKKVGVGVATVYRIQARNL